MFSPDGRSIAFPSDESGRFEVYVARFPADAASGRVRVSTAGGLSPRWGAESRELFYFEPDSGRMMTVPLTFSGNGVESSPPAALVQGPAAATLGRMVRRHQRREAVLGEHAARRRRPRVAHAPWQLAGQARSLIRQRALSALTAELQLAGLDCCHNPDAYFRGRRGLRRRRQPGASAATLRSWSWTPETKWPTSSLVTHVRTVPGPRSSPRLCRDVGLSGGIGRFPRARPSTMSSRTRSIVRRVWSSCGRGRRCCPIGCDPKPQKGPAGASSCRRSSKPRRFRSSSGASRPRTSRRGTATLQTRSSSSSFARSRR